MNKNKVRGILRVTAASLILIRAAVKLHVLAQSYFSMDDIIASQESSFCEGDLVIELSNEEECPIYYTLDGSIPTLESACYENPLTFPCSEEVQSCVIRACAYNEEMETWGSPFTRTYFYADDMQRIKDRFSTYIVCLTSDPKNLYDYEQGIMVEGKIRDEYRASAEYNSERLTQPANFTQEGREWERDVYVEILSPDGERLIAQDAGIRIFGHASRQNYYKSFKLYARKEYGKETFDYPIFSDNCPGEKDNVQDSYERLVLRAHGFDRSETLFREELFQRLCAQISGVDSKSVAPASVWLNGSYYNFEWLQEVYDARYMEENYGFMHSNDYYGKVTFWAEEPEGDAEETEEEIQAYEAYEVVEAYAKKDLTDDEVFGELCQLVDMDNMMQYFAIETYIGNWDWPYNNVKLYRYFSPDGIYGDDRQDGKWRYLYYDMEAGFNIFNEPQEKWLTIETVMEESSLFDAVMKREDMQDKFASYINLCIHEYFTEERVRSTIEKLRIERDGELEESLTYNHSMDENYTLNMEEVEKKLDVIYDFLEKRPDMMRDELWTLFGITIDVIDTQMLV